MANFSDRLKELRIEKRLTQEQLADKFYLNKSSISRYERGQQVPELELLQQISEFFSVSTDYLLGKTDIRNPYQEDTIHKAIDGDPELLEFYEEMKHRDNLKLLFKQTKDMNDKDINQILRIIKAIEDEEDGE